LSQLTKFSSYLRGKFCSQSGFAVKFVTSSGNGVDKFLLAMAFNFFTQTQDVGFNGIRERISVAIPDMLEERGVVGAGSGAKAREVIDREVPSVEETPGEENTGNDTL